MNELVDLLPIILSAFLLWLGGLTFVFYKLLGHYRKIAKRAHEGDLIQALEKVFSQLEKNQTEVNRVLAEIASIKKNSVVPLQKIGLVRFNPFDEIGGDQSFSVCLLDGEDNGFILTALHTRDRTRVYTKPIANGDSQYELSREEKKSLTQAQKK